MKKFKSASIILSIVFLSSINTYPRDIDYLPIKLEKISKYDIDRVAYQRIEKFTQPMKDNSIESLLIIKNKRIYLIKDGYEELASVKRRRFLLDTANKYYADDLVWENKINGKPDFIKTSERKSILLTNAKEEFVDKNFGAFYKSVRNDFIKRHVKVFRQLLTNQAESKLHVKIIPIKRAVYDTSKLKFTTTAIAKTYDGVLYYCEDRDGDGITETFTVKSNDGFDWGIKSGPNIIFIYNNKDKDIETLIGKLAHEASYGSVEGERKIIQSFPKEKDVKDMIKWTTPDVQFNN